MAVKIPAFPIFVYFKAPYYDCMIRKWKFPIFRFPSMSVTEQWYVVI